MPINGINITNDHPRIICHVDEFSDCIKEKIKTNLQNIFHGSEAVKNRPNYHTYTNTLKCFFDRYKDKSNETKKGMIGELLAHILISDTLSNLRTISIYKNKEERSIKKGFDIVYIDNKNSLWYSEVKSGDSAGASADNYNFELLTRAINGITDMFDSKRESLWESAIIDAYMTIDSESQISVQDLLTGNSPMSNNENDMPRNAILVSVLYHDVKERMTQESLNKLWKNLSSRPSIASAIIFSIQKSTLKKVEDFLKSEAGITDGH
ncbi:Hachiman antiphage defense system protein HamA [Hymenobacter perfusus]|uniref:DUF1837 domain-containing protein n=1 Tax=Hymenobacter perfusus TaxID=1236770 RepID=A0A428K3X3_9BACT|nr:Hachiman antiphage defense system protein HamA [Hymenobacter perfusus]RSK41104.1 DUF1837 domain-containing protein [Hymenobacter perfusus]